MKTLTRVRQVNDTFQCNKRSRHPLSHKNTKTYSNENLINRFTNYFIIHHEAFVHPAQPDTKTTLKNSRRKIERNATIINESRDKAHIDRNKLHRCVVVAQQTSSCGLWSRPRIDTTSCISHECGKQSLC